MGNHTYLIALRWLHYLVSGTLSEEIKEDTKLDIHTAQQGLCSFILPELSEAIKEDTKLDIHTAQQGLCSFILPELS